MKLFHITTKLQKLPPQFHLVGVFVYFGGILFILGIFVVHFSGVFVHFGDNFVHFGDIYVDFSGFLVHLLISVAF